MGLRTRFDIPAAQNQKRGMMLAEPNQTAWDLKFSLFGFPVRIHPLFFLMPVVMASGAAGGDLNAGVALLVVTAVFLVSILVHELGHALAFRYYGIDSHIVLYLMGGLAIPSGFAGWRGARQRSVTPGAQIAISLAGPFAGFALAAVFLAVGLMLGAGVRVSLDDGLPLPHFDLSGGVAVKSIALWTFLAIGLWVNLFWNLINLVPVFPLDGGQVARQLFLLSDPWNGARNAAILSIIAAVLVAVWGFSTGNRFAGIFFAMLAISNYQMLGGGFGSRPW